MKIAIGRKVKNNTVLYVAIIAISVILYLGNMFTFNTSDIVSAVCIVMFPLLDVSGVLAMMAFLIPLNSGITILYIYGYAIVILLLKKGTINLRVLIPVILIALWEIVMSFFVPKADWISFVIYVCTVFLLFYMLYTDEADYKQCCYAYIMGTMVLLLAVMTTAIQNTSWEEVMGGQVRIGAYEGREALGGTVAVLTENSNSLAYYALVAIILSFSLIKTEKLTGKILLTVSMLFGILVGMFTVSRAFVIVLLVGIFLVFTSRYNIKQKIILAVIIGGILWISVSYLMEKTDIFQAFDDRFADENLQGGNGRVDLFVEYMEFLWNHPLRLIFGTGAVSYKAVCQCSNSLHSGIQQILVSYGLIVFFPFLYVLLKPVLAFFQKNRFALEKIVPLLCVIIFTQTIQFLNPFPLMLPYAIAVMYMKIPEKELKA